MNIFAREAIAAAAIGLLAAAGAAHAQTGSAPSSGSDGSTTRPMQGNGTQGSGMQGSGTSGSGTVPRPEAGTPGSDPYPPQVGTGAESGNRTDGRQMPSPGGRNQGATTTSPSDSQFPNSDSNWNNNGRRARGDRG